MWVWKSDDSDHKAGDPLGYIPGGYDVASEYITENGKYISKVDPSEQESSGIGGMIKNIFKSDKWALRGLNSINRGDVNAVGLG